MSIIVYTRRQIAPQALVVSLRRRHTPDEFPNVLREIRKTRVECHTGHRVPALHHVATGFLELRRTRCNLAAAGGLNDSLQARLVVGGLASKRGSEDPIPNRSTYLSTNGTLGSVRGNPLGPKLRCELLAPTPERRLADVQPPPVFTETPGGLVALTQSSAARDNTIDIRARESGDDRTIPPRAGRSRRTAAAGSGPSPGPADKGRMGADQRP